MHPRFSRNTSLFYICSKHIKFTVLVLEGPFSLVVSMLATKWDCWANVSRVQYQWCLGGGDWGFRGFPLYDNSVHFHFKSPTWRHPSYSNMYVQNWPMLKKNITSILFGNYISSFIHLIQKQNQNTHWIDQGRKEITELHEWIEASLIMSRRCVQK